jgi:hypothetical protein
LFTDGDGVPLGLVVSGANTHDKRLVEPTLESIPVPRPTPKRGQPQHLYGDKGYDYPDVLIKSHFVKAWKSRESSQGHSRPKLTMLLLFRTPRYSPAGTLRRRDKKTYSRFVSGLSSAISAPPREYVFSADSVVPIFPKWSESGIR